MREECSLYRAPQSDLHLTHLKHWEQWAGSVQHPWTSCSCKACLGHTILLNISLSFLTQFDGKVRGYWTFRIIRNFSQFDTHVFFLHIKKNQYSFIISQFGFFNNILKDTKQVKNQIFTTVEPHLSLSVCPQTPPTRSTKLRTGVHLYISVTHFDIIMLPSNHLARGNGQK